MPNASKTKPIHLSRVLAAVVLMCWVAPGGAQAGWLKSAATLPVVVFDPGHGGSDHGVRGPSGLLEKDVALSLARALAEQLSGRYRIVLTRDDDYGLALNERTSVANHEKAALFVSLHSGGSFRATAGGMAVYFCGETVRTSLPVASLADTSTVRDPVLWNSVYLRHQTTSQRLARLVAVRLKSLMVGTEVNSQTVPLLVLKGANMPSVLIETGYLTNPVDEKKLSDPDHINSLALAVGQAIDMFFKAEND